MQITVYADMLFLVNWLMDYALLRAVSCVLQLEVRRWRMAVGAVLGAAWVCLIAVVPLPASVEKMASMIVISSLMIGIAFRPKQASVMLRALVTLYGIAILGGGLINLVYFHTDVGSFLKQLVWGRREQGSSPAAVVLLCAAAVYAAVRFIRWVTHYRGRQGNLYTAVLYLGEETVTLKGLLDTGNRLREPITKKAVHIAQKESLATLRPDREGIFTFAIPFRSVGTEAGLLTALRIDRMELISSDGQRITVEKPLIGMYEGSLSSENEYQIILHTEIETRQGETL